MKILKQFFYFLFALIIVYYIYSISLMLLKIGFKDASRDFYFGTLLIYLTIPLVHSLKLKRKIDVVALDTYEKIDKSIKVLGDKTNRLSDVILKTDKLEVKVQNIIITEKGLFNIVRCNYDGTILIEDDFTWTKREKRGLKQLKSPVEEIRRNREILSKVLEEEKIVDLIIMMDDRVELTDEKNCKVDIIRYNDIGNYIMNYNTNREYDEEEIYDKIYPLIYKVAEIKEDRGIYHKFLESKWKYRGRVFIFFIFFIFYLKNLIV